MQEDNNPLQKKKISYSHPFPNNTSSTIQVLKQKSQSTNARNLNQRQKDKKKYRKETQSRSRNHHLNMHLFSLSQTKQQRSQANKLHRVSFLSSQEDKTKFLPHILVLPWLVLCSFHCPVFTTSSSECRGEQQAESDEGRWLPARSHPNPWAVDLK